MVAQVCKKFLNYEILLKMHRGLVEPYFSFCLLVWGCCGETSAPIQHLLYSAASHAIFPYISLQLVPSNSATFPYIFPYPATFHTARGLTSICSKQRGYQFLFRGSILPRNLEVGLPSYIRN